MKSRNSSRFGALHALLPDLSPLRTGDFRLLYFGQMISGFGSALTYVVLPIQMYQLTYSTVMVGLLGVPEFVPLLLVAFVGGAVADHFDRRHVIVGCDWLMTVVLGVLTANALAPHPHVPLLFAAAGILAALNFIALNSIRGNAAFIAGPGIAGWIAVTFGPACAFGVDAATYLCGIAALLAMRRKQFKGGDEGGLSWHGLLEGWRYALQRKDLLGTYLIRHERHVFRHA